MGDEGLSLSLLLAPALGAAAVSFALAPLTMRLARRVGAVDLPGPRKVHSAAVPRLGGLAVITSVTVVGTALAVSGMPSFERLNEELILGAALGLLPILIVSLVDDLRPLPALPKALCHLAGASIAVSLGVRLNPEIHLFGQELSIGWLAIPLSVLWLVGLTNAFNLVDGLDGLSAGLALISAGSLGAVSLVVGRFELVAVAFMLAGSLIGFLPYNLHPARTFLGDAGATGVGFCLGCLALKGGSTLSSGLAVLVPLIVLGLPIAETLVSMARRFARRIRRSEEGRIFEANGEHFHHRLLKLGLDHRRVVLLLHGIGIALGTLGVLALFVSQRHAALLLGAIGIAALIGLSRLGYEEFDLIRKGDMLRLYDVPVLRSALFIALMDLAIVALALYVAWGLKYDDWLVVAGGFGLERLLAVAPLFALVAFWSMGLYRRSWKIATTADLTLVGGAVTASTFLTLVFGRLFWTDPQPVSYFVIFLFLFCFGAAGGRASYRILAEWMRRSRRRVEGEPVLIYGVGVSAFLALREILQNKDLDKLEEVIAGYPVVASLDTLEEALETGEVLGLMIALTKIRPERSGGPGRSASGRGSG